MDTCSCCVMILRTANAGKLNSSASRICAIFANRSNLVRRRIRRIFSCVNAPMLDPELSEPVFIERYSASTLQNAPHGREQFYNDSSYHCGSEHAHNVSSCLSGINAPFAYNHISTLTDDAIYIMHCRNCILRQEVGMSAGIRPSAIAVAMVMAVSAGTEDEISMINQPFT